MQKRNTTKSKETRQWMSFTDYIYIKMDDKNCYFLPIYTKMMQEFQRFGCCQLVLAVSFAARFHAVATGKTSCSVDFWVHMVPFPNNGGRMGLLSSSS